MSYTEYEPPGVGNRLSAGAITLNCVKSLALLATLSVARKFPKTLRKYEKPTDTRGITCYWTPIENSQFHGRTPRPFSVAKSLVVATTELPNVLVSQGWHSPLATGLLR